MQNPKNSFISLIFFHKRWELLSSIHMNIMNHEAERKLLSSLWSEKKKKNPVSCKVDRTIWKKILNYKAAKGGSSNGLEGFNKLWMEKIERCSTIGTDFSQCNCKHIQISPILKIHFAFSFCFLFMLIYACSADHIK